MRFSLKAVIGYLFKAGDVYIFLFPCKMHLQLINSFFVFFGVLTVWLSVVLHLNHDKTYVGVQC